MTKRFLEYPFFHPTLIPIFSSYKNQKSSWKDEIRKHVVFIPRGECKNDLTASLFKKHLEQFGIQLAIYT